ncbi:hypothetical protein B0H34DRAFT_679082 [Crassisporium funariophilum]|nr:hypothetical protein B0H34DRAFT_679082 [Crassisporium funariophilum]
MFWSPVFNPIKDLSDLTGKVIVVTGANTGIGFSTVKHLARKGAKVYLGSRSEEKGKTAVEKLQEEGVGSGEVVFFLCDLGTPVSAKESAEGFLKLEDRLDILVNNAACRLAALEFMPTIAFTTARKTHLRTASFNDQFENWETRLTDSGTRLYGNDDGQVASAGHAMSRAANPRIRFNTLDEFKNFYENDRLSFFSRYSCLINTGMLAVSKLANILFSNRLQRDLASTSIVCIAVHPGGVYTSVHTRVYYFARLTQFLTWLFFKHPDEGAFTSVFAAASPLVHESPEKYKGAYLVPVGKIVQTAENARKVDLQDELWETTEKYLDSLKS